MIVVIIHNAQANQVQFTWEGGDPALVRDLLVKMTETMDAQYHNGARRIFVPPPVIPKDIQKKNE